MLAFAVKAQIAAEAQGGQVTMWTALGIDQELSKRWTSVTDFGYGRHSDPDNFDIAKRQGLNVVMQNFVFKINEHFGVAICAGYWRRNAYNDTPPYDSRSYPYAWRNEFRPYQKFYYDLKLKKIKISNTIRFDERFYYDQDLSKRWTTPFEFRTRFMTNWKIPLFSNQKNWILCNDEVLASTVKFGQANVLATGKHWSDITFMENRLSLYYRRSMHENRIDVDLGLMYQYWRERVTSPNFNNSLNVMVDVILRDPFSWHKEKKSQG
ncbi:MAG: DUF2490 domain-containing protein [Bacteroidetes bacterium]|nr:DUF2490 domain-containing protein [Bacteroidota bacterium]